MIDGLSVLALVPARGGSKGIAGKNLRTVGGVSLVARTVKAGCGAWMVDRVVVSSDDRAIIAAATDAGADAPFVRPSELATDAAESISVIRHAVRALGGRYDLLVLLQPTSPLLSAGDIDEAVRLCVSSGAPSCVSLCDAAKSPLWTYSLDGHSRLRAVAPIKDVPVRRQDLPASYSLNGAVYVARIDWLLSAGTFLTPATVGYVMPKERSVDIDDELDLVVAEAIHGWMTRRRVAA